MIFDCHRHLSPAKVYDLEVVKSNYIFNDVASYQQNVAFVSRQDAVSVIFDIHQNEPYIKSVFDSGKLNAFKIHSRVQKLRAEDYELILQHLLDWNVRIPIIVDAFYFGQDLDYQPSLPFIVSLAKKLPNTPIVVAHAGGYELLKYFFHLKELTNIFLDLSFSLQYLADSSLFLDLKKVLRFWDRSRIMFGSDFPYASPSYQADIFTGILKDLNYAESELHQVQFSNAESIFFPSR